MNNDVSQLCASYLEVYPEERQALSVLFAQLDHKGAATIFSRSEFDTGHITAAGFIVVTGTRHVLLVRHRLLGLDLQPGGHVEPGDSSLLDAALREVQEETGLAPAKLHYVPLLPAQRTVPLDVSVHFIPPHPYKGEPEHYHYDFRYLFTVPTDFAIRTNPSESISARWISFDDFSRMFDFAGPAQKIKKLLGK